MNNNVPLCPVCQNPLSVRLARGRKSLKPSIMLICPVDGRHLRAFITSQDYVKQFISAIESKGALEK